MRTLSSFRNAHAGEAVVVCGCGESLNQLKSPERFVTIGVNDVGRLFAPDYLVVVNPRSQFAGDRFRYVEHSRARYVFSQLDLGLPAERLVKFRLGAYNGTDFARADVLHYTQNSPYVALCLAVLMGARRVGLIGVDFTDHHFFARTGRHSLTAQLKTIDEQYRKLCAALRARGVEVYNLSSASRLTAFPKLTPDEFAARFGAKVDGRAADGNVNAESPDGRVAPAAPSSTFPAGEPLRVVSYSTMPVVGVPAVFARSVTARTPHAARCVWARSDYGNGIAFEGYCEWTREPARAAEELRAADLVVIHNGKVEPRHLPLLAGKPVVTMAHNCLWNVDQRFVRGGFPAVVVGQYQASLPEFAGWSTVPNPVPLWEPEFRPGPKGETVTICYTPAGKHDVYPAGHQLYWHSKGYAATMRALERVAARFPVRLEVVRRQLVSHAEALAMKRRAHIVIDECVTGSYHRNSLEGLAAGCVVVNNLGLRPEVTEVFRRCAPTAPPAPGALPFVRAGLGELEAVLASLVERGAATLAEEGAANRRWMEAHWDFAAQWERFWAPVVARALEHAASVRATLNAPRAVVPTPAPRARVTRAATTAPRATAATNKTNVTTMTRKPIVTIPSARPSSTSSSASTSSTSRAPLRLVTNNATREGVTVVIPHGGRERLPHLEKTLARLSAVAGVRSRVVVEMDDAPHALEAARRLADGYAFIKNDGGPFHKARAMNAGLAFAETEFVLWLDNDLLLPSDFITGALAEMHRRRLDCLVPWTSVRYLSREDTARVFAGARDGLGDCRHVNSISTRQGACGGAVLVRRGFVERHGGMCEEFRGWGGEDNAWFHRARVLGAAAVTARQDQHLYHLFHERSGGHDAANHHLKNPRHEENAALLRDTRRLHTRERLLARFPAPAHLTCPWDAARRVAFLTSGDDAPTTAAAEIGDTLRTLYGFNVEHVITNHDDAHNSDALVVFDERLALRLLSDESLRDTRPKLVVVHGGKADDFSDDERELLRRARAHFALTDKAARSLDQAGLDCWRPFGDEASGDPATGRALGLVQPLSLVINAPTATAAATRATFKQRPLHQRTDRQPMHTDYTPPAPVADLAHAREADLALTEFAAFNHGRDYPRARRWQMPFALFKSRLACTSAVLDCTADPADFGARLQSLYPHAVYRHHDPLRQNQFAPPLGVPDRAFDRALCLGTLERLDAQYREALLAELAYKLKPGGLLVLASDFDPADPGRLAPQELITLCARHGLRPHADDEAAASAWAAASPTAAGFGAVFVKGDGRALLPAPRKIVLALLTWNTRDISLEALHALAREAAMLKRLGHEASVVVCDNGSTDGTREALEEAGGRLEVEHRFILNGENRGSSLARNQIIDYFLEAGGDYLLFTDGDIELVPFSSFAMLRHMEDGGHLLGCLGAYSYHQSPLREKTSRCLYSLAGLPLRDDDVVAWTQYGVFRREVFEAGVRFDVANPFDREGWGFEDNDLAFQMTVKGYRIRYFEGMTYLHRDLHSSMRIMRAQGSDPLSYYEARKRYVIQKWAGTPGISEGPLRQMRVARAPTGT